MIRGRPTGIRQRGEPLSDPPQLGSAPRPVGSGVVSSNATGNVKEDGLGHDGAVLVYKVVIDHFDYLPWAPQTANSDTICRNPASTQCLVLLRLSSTGCSICLSGSVGAQRTLGLIGAM